MSDIAKWIGGTTAALAGIVGALVIAGNALEAQDTRELQDWLSADDVLAQDDTVTAPPPAPEREFVSEPVVQPVSDTPSPAEDAPLVIKRILPIDGPIRYGEWHWDDEGVPEGPLVMTVDLEARVISVFQGGYEIGAAAALLGTQEHPTPTGTFPILTKERHNVSEKYGNAPMPWTLRLTWDGVAIHGGSDVQLGYASHGCISVPDEFASRLFDIAEKGDRVIITRGQTAGIGTSLAS